MAVCIDYVSWQAGYYSCETGEGENGGKKSRGERGVCTWTNMADGEWRKARMWHIVVYPYCRHQATGGLTNNTRVTKWNLKLMHGGKIVLFYIWNKIEKLLYLLCVKWWCRYAWREFHTVPQSFIIYHPSLHQGQRHHSLPIYVMYFNGIPHIFVHFCLWAKNLRLLWYYQATVKLLVLKPSSFGSPNLIINEFLSSSLIFSKYIYQKEIWGPPGKKWPGSKRAPSALIFMARVTFRGRKT